VRLLCRYRFLETLRWILTNLLGESPFSTLLLKLDCGYFHCEGFFWTVKKASDPTTSLNSTESRVKVEHMKKIQIALDQLPPRVCGFILGAGDGVESPAK